jgi:hypothetical protein
MTIDYSDIRDRNGAGVVDPSPANITYVAGVIGENTTAHDPDFVGGGTITCCAARRASTQASTQLDCISCPRMSLTLTVMAARLRPHLTLIF